MNPDAGFKKGDAHSLFLLNLATIPVFRSFTINI